MCIENNTFEMKLVDPEKVIIPFDSIYESSLTAKVSQKKSA